MKTLLMAFSILFVSLFTASTANAQTAEELYYYYTDVNKNVTYTCYLKVMGYQVEVWTRSNSDNVWQKCEVTNSTNENITFTDKGTVYHIERDPRNEDAMQMFSKDRSKSWKYWKGEKS